MTLPRSVTHVRKNTLPLYLSVVGRKQLRDSFLSGLLHPESSDIEFDVDPQVTCLVKKATPLPPHSASPQGVYQKKQKQMRQMLAGPSDPPPGRFPFLPFW